MTAQTIAVIPGDGIGTEVIDAARTVLDAVCARHDVALDYTEFDWSCQRYDRAGAMMPPDGIETLRRFDAILLGAVGWPGVPDHVSLWGLLIPIRRAFRQYVNMRPIRAFSGVASPLRDAASVDFVVVRENVEGGGLLGEHDRVAEVVAEDVAAQPQGRRRLGGDRLQRDGG